MRRRPRYQHLKAAGVLDKHPLALASEGINPFPPMEKKTYARGHCKHCGEYKGVALGLHQNRCKGMLGDIPDWKMREQVAAVRDAERERINARPKRESKAEMRIRLRAEIKAQNEKYRSA